MYNDKENVDLFINHKYTRDILCYYLFERNKVPISEFFLVYLIRLLTI